MSFSAPDPVASGQAYRVTSIEGSLPSTLEQFVGEVSFTVLDSVAGPSCISGHGSAQTVGVRFHQKDVDNAGKDVRIWEIVEADRDFTATAIAAF